MQTILSLILVMVTTTVPPLPPCPSSPNCVSSQASGRQFINPLKFSGEAKPVFDNLRKILEERGDTTIVEADDTEIRVEFKTALGFVDDSHFVLDAENRIIQIRSAARSGYWDLGKNRRRLEEIRQELNASGSGPR